MLGPRYNLKCLGKVEAWKPSASRWGPSFPRTRRGGEEGWGVIGGSGHPRPKGGSQLLLVIDPNCSFQVCKLRARRGVLSPAEKCAKPKTPRVFMH